MDLVVAMLLVFTVMMRRYEKQQEHYEQFIFSKEDQENLLKEIRNL